MPVTNRRQFIKLSAQTAGAVFAMTSLPNSIRLAMAAEGGAAAGDEFLWLEELQGKKALQWVQQENQRTVARFGQGEDFQRIEREVLDILNKDTQIPWVSKRGEYYYNFWQDISLDISRKRYYLPRHLCAPLGIDPQQPHLADRSSQVALMHSLLNHTDALMQQGRRLPHRLAAQAGKGNKLSALELQLVCQGGWRIGQKTRCLGPAAITYRPTLHAGDWGLIAWRTLGAQLAG